MMGRLNRDQRQLYDRRVQERRHDASLVFGRVALRTPQSRHGCGLEGRSGTHLGIAPYDHDRGLRDRNK
jgi:hypothetical protein